MTTNDPQRPAQVDSSPPPSTSIYAGKTGFSEKGNQQGNQQKTAADSLDRIVRFFLFAEEAKANLLAYRLETLRLKMIKRLGATKDEDGMWIDEDGEYVDELNADEKFIIPAKSNETL
jgi:hypothetical protein